MTAAQVNVRSVRRPFDLEHGVGDRLPAARKLFLKLGLEVHVPLECVLDPVGEHGDDRASDRLEAVFEVKRSETRLHKRGKDIAVHREALQLFGIAHAAAVFEEPLAELEAPAHDGAALPRDDVGA